MTLIGLWEIMTIKNLVVLIAEDFDCAFAQMGNTVVKNATGRQN